MNTPFRPSDINTNCHLWGAFGNMEKECSANGIIQFFQEVGVFRPFSRREIQRFWDAKRISKGLAPEAFLFNGLIEDGFVTVQDGVYEVTPEFIQKCVNSSLAA